MFDIKGIDDCCMCLQVFLVAVSIVVFVLAYFFLYMYYLQSVFQQNLSFSEHSKSPYDQQSRKGLAFSDYSHVRCFELHHSSALHGLGSVVLPSLSLPVWVSGLHWLGQLMCLLHLCHLQMRASLSTGDTWW